MKTETYTTLDCREFDKLVEQHLGFKISDDWRTMNDPGIENWQGMHQDLMANQDTYVIFDNDPKEWQSWLDDWSRDYDEATYPCREGYGALTYKFAAELFQKGVFAPDHPVFVSIWW